MKKTLTLLAAICGLSMFASFSAYAQEGKTDIIIAVDADVETLHPTDFSTTVEMTVLNQIYDTLLYVNPDGSEDPEPRIAESYEISEDGLDYTFKIRDDVTFHDGTPVTVDDVVFSIEMYKASQYQGSQISVLSSVEAVDDSTVVCHLDTPYAPFLLGISSPNISSKDYYEEDPDGFVTNPIGSGPYKFVSRTVATSLELEANEDYYRGAPAIKNVTFRVLPEIASRALALQTGEINFAEIDASVLAQLEANPAVTISEVPTSSFAYVCMNIEKEPFNNPLVREAVNYAIDRANLATVVQNDLRAIGFELEIDTREFNSYIGSLTSGDYTITTLNMTLEGDTQTLEMAFTTDYIGMANNARYSDPEMDELFNQTRSEVDTEKREALFDQILTKAQEEAIYAPMCNPLTLYAYNTDLKAPEFVLEGNYYLYDFAW